LVSFLLFQCAKIGRPGGGPKDQTPPRVLVSEPVNYSTHFTDNEINIYFDEFIELRNINQELLVSPPMKEKPEVINMGRSIRIKFNEPLKKNVTYTLNFGEAIVDFREANPLKNFKYVLSTGSHIDSLAVFGRALYAFNNQPPEDVCLVMLHKKLKDSAFYIDTPSYVGRTNKDGYFEITHVKPDTFQLFVLNDINNNYIFDLPNEEIAFADSVFILNENYYYPPVYNDTMTTDTLQNDTLQVDTIVNNALLNDTIHINDTAIANVSLDDTLIQQKNMKDSTAIEIDTNKWIPDDSISYDNLYNRMFRKKASPVNMYLFEELPPVKQFLKDYSRTKPYKITLIFNQPVTDTYHINLVEPLNNDSSDWFIKEKNPTNDTMMYWINDTSVSNRQNITICARYMKKDTSGKDILFNDTLLLSHSIPDKSKQKGDTIEPKLDLTLNVKDGAKFDLNQNIVIKSEHPVAENDTTFICLYNIDDTVLIPLQYRFEQRYEKHEQDTFLREREYVLSFPFEGEKEYKLEIDPGAFTDIYGFTTDSLEYGFTTYAEDYYGTLKLLADTITTPLIVQLMDTKEKKIYREQYLDEKGFILFDFLHPEKYKIKVIFDKNKNRQWDTGDFDEHQQPERVIYYRDNIEVRSNWDTEIEWQ
jgi:hypothetical protein